jgi:hypothetical protein
MDRVGLDLSYQNGHRSHCQKSSEEDGEFLIQGNPSHHHEIEPTHDDDDIVKKEVNSWGWVDQDIPQEVTRTL